MELKHDAYFGGDIEPSSHKNEKNNKQDKRDESLGENWKAPLDNEKVKRKDASEGENLSKAPKDGGFNILPIAQEKHPCSLKNQ